MTRRWTFLAILAAALAALFGYAFLEARRDPMVREASLTLPGWPAGAGPVRLVLISDVHAGNLAMSPDRLARIVRRINALSPDLVLIAGDFFPGHAAIDAAKATGVVAVPGNHDHWTGLGAVRSALTAAGVQLLANAAQRRGPLAIGAVDDDYSHHAETAKVVDAVRRLPGAGIMFTHSPDIAPQLPPDFPLLLAGHTHCGQAVIPFYGSLDPVSRYQDRYRCGIVREGGRRVIVTGGLGGTLPFRLNSPPDLWLLTLGPAARANAAR